MAGLAAAGGIVTTRGGPASHAAVVARAMGTPAVVGAGAIAVDPGAGTVTGNGRTIHDGALVTIDGSSGHVVLGAPTVIADDPGPHLDELLAWADDAARDHSDRSPARRLSDARTALTGTATPLCPPGTS
jgi:pyruvate,orthophosphate dikinase